MSPLRSRVMGWGFRITVFYKSRHNITPQTMEPGRAKVSAALDHIESELQPSGYLVGNSFTVARISPQPRCSAQS